MLRSLATLLLITGALAVDVCNRHNSVNISNGLTDAKGDIIYRGVRYAKNEYYIEPTSGEPRGCMCKKKLCIRKCCPFGMGYDYLNKICVNTTEPFEASVWDSYKKLDGVRATEKFQFLIGKLNCTPPEYRVRAGQYSGSHLKQDGSLYVDMPLIIPPWMIQGPDTYCVDTFLAQNDDGSWTTQLDALVCFAETQEEHFYLLTCTCMLISCVFILVTVAVYAWLPELRNLHGKVLMAYLICLFVGFALFTTMQILLVMDNINVDMCVGMTIVIYFSILTAFFWMNIMSFDIWWTFSGKRGLSLEKLSTQGRFYAYCTYAFGIPAALTVLLVALEFSNLPPHPLLPLLRHRGCFIYGPSKLLYLYGPMVILIAANTIFFVLTAVKIAQIKKQTSVLKSKESSTHDQHRKDKQRLLLYVKLFAVMGINWILEVVSALYPEADIIWRVTDAYNVLIGVIIFIIFVCKRKIYQLMKKRYMQMRGKPVSSWRETTESSRTMSRSDDDKPGSIKLQTKTQIDNTTSK